MVEALVSTGAVIWLAIGALAIELLLLLAFSRHLGPAGAMPFIANLSSGLFLILALHAALVGSDTILLFLGLGFAAHLADIVLRLRR